ncbi:transposase-like protein [Pedobacter africanus]|uniref:Transposase-like protein n=1 Tax=Pedobacter africanus TaxID=151894 RepID=A0ACC6KU08_9SPHI|nr:transposase [Pedobacter africanus]MDR6782696.1 transposase-like protein [Pedobacter africanus]
MNTNLKLSEEAIKKVLQDYYQTGYSVEEFCYANGTTQAELHQWIEEYPELKPLGSTISIEILDAEPPKTTTRTGKKQQTVETGALFARIGDIELYQYVPHSYLKSLKS